MLHLKKNKIVAEGAKHLASALEVNRVRLDCSTFLCYVHLTQTLTRLHLERNEIGAEGVQHLASALQVNRVRLDFSTF